LIHKRIPLIPTPFHVDVFVSAELADIEEALSELNGKDSGFYRLNFKEGQQAMTAEAEGNFIMVLPDFSEHVISHEATHITWMLGDKIGLDWDYQSQELQAYYIDYLVREIKIMKE
jgi:hypothetical protein